MSLDEEMANYFLMFSNLVRLRILKYLADRAPALVEVSYQELAEAIGGGATKDNVSHQCRLLRDSGLLTLDKRGTACLIQFKGETALKLFTDATNYFKLNPNGS